LYFLFRNLLHRFDGLADSGTNLTEFTTLVIGKDLAKMVIELLSDSVFRIELILFLGVVEDQDKFLNIFHILLVISEDHFYELLVLHS
jgi:hypothetical protein